jgi:hypothetical protein
MINLLITGVCVFVVLATLVSHPNNSSRQPVEFARSSARGRAGLRGVSGACHYETISYKYAEFSQESCIVSDYQQNTRENRPMRVTTA